MQNYSDMRGSHYLLLTHLGKLSPSPGVITTGNTNHKPSSHASGFMSINNHCAAIVSRLYRVWPVVGLLLVSPGLAGMRKEGLQRWIFTGPEISSSCSPRVQQINANFRCESQNSVLVQRVMDWSRSGFICIPFPLWLCNGASGVICILAVAADVVVVVVVIVVFSTMSVVFCSPFASDWWFRTKATPP